jgi:hypothetical protein
MVENVEGLLAPALGCMVEFELFMIVLLITAEDSG